MRRIAIVGLATLGLLQIVADWTGLSTVKGLAAATGASPAPKVFSAHAGLETFSTSFFLELTDARGSTRSVALTPEVYGRVQGPYNRRNPYGAVLAYGPLLLRDERARPMFEAVSHYALCGRAPLLAELGFEPSAHAGGVAVVLVPLEGTPSELARRIEVDCR